MKTNQVMVREDGFVQRTSDGYFSATYLIDFWNKKKLDSKQLGNYMKNQGTIDFINQLKKEGIENPIYTNRGRGAKAGTWVHPKVFIDLAMWVSIEFKSKVIDFVIDGLVKCRHDAGDYYNEMCKVILESYVRIHGVKPPSMIYIEEANLVKHLVSTKETKEMSESELKQITYLQKFNAILIEEGVGKASRIKNLTRASKISI